jgi:hypothetical protein
VVGVVVVTESLRTEVLTIAQRQQKRSDDEVFALLEYEWQRAGLASVDRGAGSDYLRRVARDIGRQAIQERGNIEVMSGIVADKALNWAAQHGLALDQYALIIGLLVAWVIRAMLKDSGNDDING